MSHDIPTRTQIEGAIGMVAMRTQPNVLRKIASQTALGFFAIACAAPAYATEVPDFSYCDSLPLSQEANEDRKHPISLPNEWVGVAASSQNWIAVATEFNTTYCVETTWIHEAANFERFGQRFLGFEWNFGSREAFGYILIDRAGQGRVIDTGAKPVFSPDGGYLATLSRTDANNFSFEGFAIWQTYSHRLEPIFVNDGPPFYPMVDWRIDRWEGNNCLHISAAPYDRFNGQWENIPNLPRNRYVAKIANDWQITEGENCHLVVEF